MTEQYRSRTERRKMKKNPKKTKRKKGMVKRIFTALLLIFLIFFIAGTVTVFAMLRGTPELNPELLKDPVSSNIYDKDDEEIATVSGEENREFASIQDTPELVQNATLAIEDVRFREHFGLDIRRIGGAVLANFREGFGSEGASTITQQVIKRSFLTPEKTLKRKVQEAYLAVKLEQNYSKDQILEMYLNKIYYGKGAYGIKTAAETYFQKELDELTLSEAALLAGLPQRPNYYDPTKNPEAAEKRRNTVIAAMVKYGFINEAQAEEAKEIKVADMLNPKEKEPRKYEAFIDQVIREIEEVEGLSERDIYESGLKIYTTLDVSAQENTEKTLKDDAMFPDDKFQAGVVLVDTETGEVRAIGGGRNKKKGNFNYAIQSKRQPGSAIKPILDYGPAIEHLKWSTGKIIKDEKLVINGHEIRNWDRSHRGQVSMRKALEQSYNVPAVNTFLEVGADKAKEFAANLGIEPKEELEPAYAIGGFKHGISPLQLAGAYAAFGNEGIYHKPHTVRKIVFPDGREIDNTPEPVAAMSDYTAYMITDMLKDVVRKGTGTRARVPNLPMAGKTGTTNPPPNITHGTTDGWFAGYTTRYAAAVWTGYDKTTQEQYVKEGSTIAQRIFKDVMSHASEGIDTPDFKKPDSVIEVALEAGTEKKPSPFTPKDKIVYELFVRGTGPSGISQTYNKLGAPTGLSASYNEESNSITLSWNHAKEGNVSFAISMSVDGGEATSLPSTGGLSISVPNVQAGSTYQFQVVAIDESTNQKSDPASASIKIPDPTDEEETPPENTEPEPPTNEEEQPSPPHNDNQEQENGNNNNNGENGEKTDQEKKKPGDQTNEENENTETNTKPEQPPTPPRKEEEE
ncbi:penicillin-binding protein [Pueribacillus theae]|uniref:Penicillin-binding protein n=1 Tax=Pueribacillus theae TaxID=2171751 RepID=A0A2U1JVQ1_9BACI|nr:PBP1A family penicillin-binding protein [Pueribacillus theae]PWA08903.1 penicillin-binding protein [Pueribacillus theae]